LTLEVVRQAASLNNFVEIDMEGSAYTQATVDLFEAVRRQYENVGLAVQSYLYRTEQDLRRLQPLRPKIRLVKGAYREPPSLAFPKKSQVDENYRKLMRLLFTDGFFPAIATHDEKMIELAKDIVRQRSVPADGWELQMIYGVGRNLQQQLVRDGYRMRVYIPYGTEWLPYFMRRLSERPANLWFVLKAMLLGS
jgi:proline dehydrogenase